MNIRPIMRDSASGLAPAPVRGRARRDRGWIDFPIVPVKTTSNWKSIRAFSA